MALSQTIAGQVDTTPEILTARNAARQQPPTPIEDENDDEDEYDGEP